MSWNRFVMCVCWFGISYFFPRSANFYNFTSECGWMWARKQIIWSTKFVDFVNVFIVDVIKQPTMTQLLLDSPGEINKSLRKQKQRPFIATFKTERTLKCNRPLNALFGVVESQHWHISINWVECTSSISALKQSLASKSRFVCESLRCLCHASASFQSLCMNHINRK